MFKLLIAGGGTGGHIIPAVAVAEEFIRRDPETDVLIIGSGRPLEAEIIGPRGFTLRKISSSGFMGMSVTKRLLSLILVPVGLVQSVLYLLRFKPDLVVCVGGYSSGPVGLAAKMLLHTVAVHEQNSIPGMTNKILGRMADVIFVSFEPARNSFPAEKTRLVGNPLPAALIKLSREAENSKKTENRTGFRILISGGSQGAHAVNLAVVEAMKLLAAKGTNLEVIHQTGKADYDLIRQAYREMGLDAEIKPFITDMGRAYAWADLIICRAGALTVAEVAAFGLPALFVPLPSASGHQELNTRSLVEAGAAEIIPQSELSPDLLAEKIDSLISNRTRLEQMAAQAASAARLDAARDIGDACLDLLSRKKNRGGLTRHV